MKLFIKHKAAAQGETRIRRDGKTYKKMGRKWIVVSQPKGAPRKKPGQVAEEAWQRGSDHYLATLIGTEVGETVENALNEMGITDYDALVDKVRNEPGDITQQIYTQVSKRVYDLPGIPGEQQQTLDTFGRTLQTLRDYFSTKPKIALKIKVTSRKGQEYYKYKDKNELPVVKPKALLAATRKLAGWTVTAPLESKHVRGMIAKKTAKLVSGKIDNRRSWVLPVKQEDINWKYRGDSLLIRVKQVRGMKERTRATAKAEIKIPYAYAKAFLLNQVKSKRTRNYFIFRIERSAGYRDFLERSGV